MQKQSQRGRIQVLTMMLLGKTALHTIRYDGLYYYGRPM